MRECLAVFVVVTGAAVAVVAVADVVIGRTHCLNRLVELHKKHFKFLLAF
jgi:hypothetical protein